MNLHRDTAKRLNSLKQRDEGGLAVQLIIRTTISFRAENPVNQKAWDDAREKLQEAQELLMRSGFYSEGFDPTIAAY